MFTIRFIEPSGVYRSFSVVSYQVTREGSGNAEVSLSRKLNCQDSVSEYVGQGETYDVAYITNLDGKTIDVVRHKPNEPPDQS